MMGHNPIFIDAVEGCFKTEMCMRGIASNLILWLSLAVFVGFADNVLMAQPPGQNPNAVSGPLAPASVDPNKAPSEFNHHVAGWLLIGVGLLVLISILHPNLRRAALFLASLVSVDGIVPGSFGVMLKSGRAAI